MGLNLIKKISHIMNKHMKPMQNPIRMNKCMNGEESNDWEYQF